MTEPNRTLGDELEAVFKRACEENDMQVAERLLQALEALARRDGRQGDLDHLYLGIADCLHPPSCH